MALDEKSGKLLWQTKIVPTNLGYSGGSIWDSTPVIDAARNSVYVGTGNNFSVPSYVKTCFANNQNNPNCAASNDYFNSVIALDLNTGRIKWNTSGLNYDTWNTACLANPSGTANCPSPAGPDYDFGGAGPNMLSIGGLWNPSELVRRAASIGRWNPLPEGSFENPGRPRLLARRDQWGTAFDRTQNLCADFKPLWHPLCPPTQRRDRDRGLLGGVESDHRPRPLADCNRGFSDGAWPDNRR